MKFLIPKKLKRRLFRYYLTRLHDSREQQEQKYPKFNLQEKHLANSRLVSDRIHLLSLLPKNATVAELGVAAADFSEEIASICKPAKLHLIDVWDSEMYGTPLRNKVETIFEKEISDGKVEINLGYSTEVVNDFPDRYFDWIYIDTDHTYKTTLLELMSYKDKMKANGIIAGHDFVKWVKHGIYRVGVKEAVSEFCVKEGWEILYLTVEHDSNTSFAIRKIIN